MKNNFKFAAMALVSTLVLSSCKNELVSSHFKKDSENWTIKGDAQGDSAEPTYEPENGMADGYIHAKDDAAGGVWYFSAPDAYLGNKKDFYGRTLSYSLFQKPRTDSQFDSPDIVLTSGENQIFYLVEDYPDTTWTHYEVKISADKDWFVGEHKSKQIATEAEIKMVLSKLEKFWIRGEYRSGADWGGLDEVVIK